MISEHPRLEVLRPLSESGDLLCVYCGHAVGAQKTDRYGPSDEVPASMADVLKAHVEQCPEHPMSKLRKDFDLLVSAIALERAVCLCGCPLSEHESYGEDGESCQKSGDDTHVCLRVSLAVQQLYGEQRAQLEALRNRLTGVLHEVQMYQPPGSPPPGDEVVLVRWILSELAARAVTRIRCVEHRDVPPYNSNDASGGECAACEVESLRRRLGDLP